MSETREYISVTQAADLAKVSRRSITEWLKAGKITKHKARNGWNVLIDKAELLAFDAARRGIDPNQLELPFVPQCMPTVDEEMAAQSMPNAFGRFG